MVQPYKHEPFTDFNNEANNKAFQVALNDVAKELGNKYPLVINGEKIFTDEVITSVNPADKKEVIGIVSKANKDLAEQAMQAADKTFQTWRKTKAEMRANILFRARTLFGEENTTSQLYWLKRQGSPGMKRMLIQRKQSTLWNTTHVKC